MLNITFSCMAQSHLSTFVDGHCRHLGVADGTGMSIFVSDSALCNSSVQATLFAWIDGAFQQCSDDLAYEQQHHVCDLDVLYVRGEPAGFTQTIVTRARMVGLNSVHNITINIDRQSISFHFMLQEWLKLLHVCDEYYRKVYNLFWMFCLSLMFCHLSCGLSVTFCFRWHMAVTFSASPRILIYSEL